MWRFFLTNGVFCVIMLLLQGVCIGDILENILSGDEKMSYAAFIARYGEFAKDLYEMYEACNDSFEKTEESVLYNRGTMERDEEK